MIKTKKFQLTQKEYFSFIIRILLKKIGWLFALMILISIALIFKDNKNYTQNSVMVFGFFLPAVSLFQLWRFANSKENRNFFVEIQYEVFTDKIFSTVGETSESTIAIQNFIKALELKDLYLLYISKGQCFYFPKRIFESQEDENWFRNEVFLKIKKK
ncbi:MAG: YcxB family protein [Flavobacterium sp.]|uniref:YcxB family protein n=1 Tax=Flavobacterium sp. TaxID=239 RepID=UPI001B037B85|nr:YcxB family protein [Flavobacterium sp.]MBO9583297.1 YcxB family protein [Flavobacterium sp.]